MSQCLSTSYVPPLTTHTHTHSYFFSHTPKSQTFFNKSAINACDAWRLPINEPHKIKGGGWSSETARIASARLHHYIYSERDRESKNPTYRPPPPQPYHHHHLNLTAKSPPDYSTHSLDATRYLAGSASATRRRRRRSINWIPPPLCIGCWERVHQHLVALVICFQTNRITDSDIKYTSIDCAIIVRVYILQAIGMCEQRDIIITGSISNRYIYIMQILYLYIVYDMCFKTHSKIRFRTIMPRAKKAMCGQRLELCVRGIVCWTEKWTRKHNVIPIGD